jgi:hypothetical protein
MLEIKNPAEKTLEIVSTHRDRFLLVGSYGRAALVGDNISNLTALYGRSKRFQDVDTLDTTGHLRTMSQVPGGAVLDNLLTLQYRPLDDSTWGLFDRHAPDDPALVSVDASYLPIVDIDLPDIGTIRTFGPEGHLMLSHSLDYMRPYVKHSDQVTRIHEMFDYEGSVVDQAITEYTAKMLERHPVSGIYARAAKSVFGIAPGLSLAISDGLAGSVIRTLRRSNSASALIPELDTHTLYTEASTNLEV